MIKYHRLHNRNPYSKASPLPLSKSFRKALICILTALTLIFTLFAFQYNDNYSSIPNSNLNTTSATPSLLSSQISQLHSQISSTLSNYRQQSEGSSGYPFEVYTSGRNDIKTISYEVISETYDRFLENTDQATIDWSQYAYVTYSTNIDYLKSAILNAKRLREVTKTKADIVILHSSKATNDWGMGYENRMIGKAERKYNVKVHRVDSLSFGNGEWNEGFTKFYAFSLVSYQKVIYFDADCLIYNNFDELFFSLPDAMIYAPPHYSFFRDIGKELKVTPDVIVTPQIRDQYIESITGSSLNDDGTVDLNQLYYKLPSIKKSMGVLRSNDKPFQLTDYFFVCEPNKVIFDVIIDQCNNITSRDEFDMDIFNKFIELDETIKNNIFEVDEHTSKPFIMILPHNPYALNSGEFKYLKDDHNVFLVDPQDLIYHSSNPTDGQPLPYWHYNNDKEDTGYGWYSSYIYESVKSLHFSDYPVPKPWISFKGNLMDEVGDRVRNQCNAAAEDDDEVNNDVNDDGCSAIDLWYKIYKDYEGALNSI